MDSTKNLSVVFGLIIFLLICMWMFSFYFLNTIAGEVKNLYFHPYAVSNAARNININLVSMHRYMKDVVLAEDEAQLTMATGLVGDHEQQVLENFETIFDRYLGKRTDIQTAYKAFIDWKSIREEVITLKRQGRDRDAAAITKGKGAEHVALLNKETQHLIDFADNKAKAFLNAANDGKQQALFIITTLWTLTLGISITISIYSIRHLRYTQADMRKRIHLIDQNIMMAKLDKNGAVQDISNSLCRYLGVMKKEMQGQTVHFFINDENGDTRPEHILRIASTGKSWEGEICRKTRDGNIQWIHSIVHPDLDDNYNIVGYTNIIDDITDRKAVEELSVTDMLTSLYNRRYFDYVIEKEIRASHRNKTSIAFAVIDIDYFKKYNDQYGHPSGDNVLMHVAQVLKQSLKRSNDYAFRLGGEEFGIIISINDMAQANKFFDALKDRVESLKIEHGGSDVSDYLTISVGAHTSIQGAMMNSNQMYLKADEALYRAKQQRNFVVVT
ncbi:MAG: diguanylate cyclase [Desulfobacterales bacterium]|nr:diguanylate cyclase [Desulfobacterales bacterium]